MAAKRKAASGVNGSVQIYALRHPLTGEIRYIGKSKDAQKRLKAHIRRSREQDWPVSRWIRKLALDGLTPSITIITSVEGDWQSVERGLIEVARAEGFRLLNVAAGGEAPYCPPETRAENLKGAYKNFPAIMSTYRKLESRIEAAKRRAEKGGTGCCAESVIRLRLAKDAFSRAVSFARQSGQIEALEARMKGFKPSGPSKQQEVEA